MSSIIRARGLTKRFGDFTAVDDLTIEVEAGSVFAFLGANGSGKSTTIRMLIGLLRPTGGTIEVDGIDVVASPRRVRDRIGYMGQKVSLYAGLSLRENAEFYGGLYGLSNGDLARRWGELRERFALAGAENEKSDALPAGVRQRAGLALATLHRPRLLFLDEPTAGVDVQNRDRFWELIQEHAAAGVTVFVTTHFLEEADYCDRVSFIDTGRLVADASPEELRARYSDGYRIEVETDPEARPLFPEKGSVPFFDELGDAGAVVVGGDERRRTFRAPRLDAPLLDELDRLARAGAAVRIEPAPMTDVFRRLVAEAASARREAA